jgi:RNA 3'-terminal phosphate cyclase (ATP)
MLTIDGSFGEGGGQILRSSLALSLVTGQPFRLVNIRAGRQKPGLLAQHLTAVRAAAAVGGAAVEGATPGSRSLTFRPGRVTPGEYEFSIGTAGSATLVLQAVLPALLMAGGPSRLTLSGGTHNPGAPPYDYLHDVFVPLVNRLGPHVAMSLERPGFFPAGGGRFSVQVEPARSWQPLHLLACEDVAREEPAHVAPLRVSAKALIARLPLHIAQRELAVVARELSVSERDLTVEEIKNSAGPGNVLLIRMDRNASSEMVTGFGRRGVPAEDVAGTAAAEAQAFLATGMPVGPHLADQLLIPLALAGGGSFEASELTLHATTNIEVVQKFLDVEVRVEGARVTVSRH